MLQDCVERRDRLEQARRCRELGIDLELRLSTVHLRSAHSIAGIAQVLTASFVIHMQCTACAALYCTRESTQQAAPALLHYRHKFASARNLISIDLAALHAL